MSENYLSFQQREKCFLLTSPFIEPGLGKNEKGRVASGRCTRHARGDECVASMGSGSMRIRLSADGGREQRFGEVFSKRSVQDVCK